MLVYKRAGGPGVTLADWNLRLSCLKAPNVPTNFRDPDAMHVRIASCKVLRDHACVVATERTPCCRKIPHLRAPAKKYFALGDRNELYPSAEVYLYAQQYASKQKRATLRTAQHSHTAMCTPLHRRPWLPCVCRPHVLLHRCDGFGGMKYPPSSLDSTAFL